MFAVDISLLIDWRYLLVFAIGIAFGCFFMLLVYVYSLFASLRKKKRYKRNPVVIDEREIENLIKAAQDDFKDKEQRKELGFFTHFKNVNLELVYDISEKYYPASKYPQLELTIEEVLELVNYISQAINKLLSKKLINKVKKFTISGIVKFVEPKNKEEEQKALNETNTFGKKMKGAFKKPFTHLKSFAADIVIDKLGLASIGIVGEESYNIYSKSVFKDPEDINVDVDKLYEDIIGDSSY